MFNFLFCFFTVSRSPYKSSVVSDATGSRRYMWLPVFSLSNDLNKSASIGLTMASTQNLPFESNLFPTLLSLSYVLLYYPSWPHFFKDSHFCEKHAILSQNRIKHADFGWVSGILGFLNGHKISMDKLLFLQYDCSASLECSIEEFLDRRGVRNPDIFFSRDGYYWGLQNFWTDYDGKSLPRR